MFYPNNNEICTVISVSKIGTPTAAHLHAGNPGENGPVKLKPPKGGAPSTTASGASARGS